MFVEMSGAEDEAEVEFKNSHLFEILDRFENTIRIHVQLPISANGQPCNCHFERFTFCALLFLVFVCPK